MFFRVLLVGFSLFGPGAARAPHIRLLRSMVYYSRKVGSKYITEPYSSYYGGPINGLGV